MEENLQKNENELTNNNNNKNGIIAVLVVIIIALIGAVIYFAFIKKDAKPVENGKNGQEESGQKIAEDEPKHENELIQDESVETGTYGVAYVDGYTKIVEKSLCDDGPDVCQGDEPKVNEVLFYVTNGKVDTINDWFSINEDDNTEYLALGCLENNVISFIAMADEFDIGSGTQESSSREIKINQNDSEKILSATESNPITLRIEKKKFKKDVRLGLYRCNAMITGVEVVK